MITIVDITALKQKIIDNPELIELILENLDCTKIRNYGKEYRAAYLDSGDGTAVCIQKENLYSVYYGKGKNVKGDIFVLVQEFKDLKFRQSIDFICKTINFEPVEDKPIKEVFGGFFKKFKAYSDKGFEIDTYSESELEQYVKMPNQRFLRDGIDIQTQIDLDIRYDLLTDRIVVPWTHMGELIGATGRINSDDYDEFGQPKWLAMLPFPKSKALYGFDKNYNHMANGTIIIGESEKFTAQLKSMGINKGVAVGNHSISMAQKNLIHSLFPQRIVVCFDEGIDEGLIREETMKLKMQNAFINPKVQYLYDKNNMYLPKGSKMSPSDLGKDGFVEIYKNCLITV